jgi:hypothetical protein
MSDPARSRAPHAAALLVGAAYLVAGLAFAALAGAAASQQMRFAWRLAAWVVSAAAFAAHIGYEHFRVLSSPRTTAWRTSLAVAFGTLGLAVAANMHALWVVRSWRINHAIALVVWPVATAVPAFVVALAAAAALAHTRRSA